MNQALQLPCRRCGRALAVPMETGMSLPLCAACAEATGGVATGVEIELPSHLAPSPPPAAPPRAGRGRGAWVWAAVPVGGGLLVVAAAGLGWWLVGHRDADVDRTAAARPSVEAPGAAVIGLLQGGAGTIEAPARLLVAQAWSERTRGTPTGLREATRLAEAAVARAPDDVEALALLATLYAEAGVEPERASALTERAAALAPGSPLVAAADAERLLAAGDARGAGVQLQACLAAAPEDLVCAEIEDRLHGGGSVERRAETEALAARWPEHRGLARRAVLAAVAAGGADAEPAVQAALKRFPGDPVLVQARARLRLAAGDVATAGTLVRSLGADAPPDVVVALAGAAVRAGDGAGARAWVDLVGETGTDAERAEIRLRRAQALVIEAQAAPGDAARTRAAQDAALAALEVGRGDPAAIQAALLAARAGRDFASGQRAFERLEGAGADRRDLAAVHLARVALDVTQGVPQQAQRWMDEALRLDAASPDVCLWAAALAVNGQNPGAALAALRRAVATVETSGPTPLPRTLRVPADVAGITTGLVTLVGTDATRERELTLGLAVLDWLGGQADRAIARVNGAVGGSDDASLHALQARLLWERGDRLGAAEAMVRARQLDGRNPAWVELARRIDTHGGD